MDKPNVLKLGQVVLSKQGKDQGRFYVIVGLLSSGSGLSRVALADGKNFNIRHPKLKNPAHVQPTSCHATSLLLVIKSGQNINRGRLVQILREHFKNRNGERK